MKNLSTSTLVALALLAPPPALAQDHFKIVNVDADISVNRPDSSAPSGINNRGQIVFNGLRPNSSQNKTWVFGPVTPAGPKLVEPPSVSQNSTFGSAINDNGRVVGTLFDGDYVGDAQNSFRWEIGATMTILPKLFSSDTQWQIPYSCNATQIVGKAKNVNAGVAAFILLSTNNAFTTLDVPATQSGCARDVNSSGACAGDHTTNGGRACWWSSEGIRTDIPLPDGYATSTGLALNDSNVVVGIARKLDSTEVGYKWVQSTNTLTTFSPATYGRPVDINSAGDILFNGDDPKILLADGTTIWNLETMETGSPNWTMGTAVALNDSRLVTLVGKNPAELPTPVNRALLAAQTWSTSKNIPISVSLGSWGQSDQPLTVRFALRYGDADVEAYDTNYTFNQGTSHEFQVPTTMRGSVTANVSLHSDNDHRHWLRKSITLDVPISGSAQSGSVALVNGDINNTNQINTDDYLDLNAAFDTVPGDSKWNVRCDLDGNDEINTDDYLILSDNFDTTGDN